MDVESLLKFMVKKKASDLFITAGVAPSFKVHGKLEPLSRTGLTPDQARALVFSIMSSQHRATFERTMECNFALHVADVGRFRVNVFQQQNHVGMVLRRIETAIPDVDDLGLPPLVKELVMAKRGLILFVGATGTGKSTSLAAMIGYRNRHSSGHIVTIEEPIEFVHEHAGCIVTQREVGIDTESFLSALKNALRQSPDVILIGEIRTREAMEHALTFGETGHLCFSTLHANNAYQTLERVVNFFPEERRQQLLLDLSMNLNAVIAQRLVPKANGQGQRVAVEVLLNTPLAADLIMKGELHLLKDLMKKSTALGMKTFDQALFELYEAHEVSYDDAVQYADSPNEVRLMVKLGKAADHSTVAPELKNADWEMREGPGFNLE